MSKKKQKKKKKNSLFSFCVYACEKAVQGLDGLRALSGFALFLSLFQGLFRSAKRSAHSCKTTNNVSRKNKANKITRETKRDRKS